MHGYDIGGPKWGWVGEVKSGYQGRNAWRVLLDALEQCERTLMQKGLLDCKPFAVLHRPGERLQDALVMFRGDEGELVVMSAWDFRLYLETQGVVRWD